MLIGKKSRAADEIHEVLVRYPVLNEKKKKRIRCRASGKGVLLRGYLRRVFDDVYLADLPLEIRWEQDRLTVLLDLCPPRLLRTMSLPRQMLSMSARLAYNLRAERTQILQGTHLNGYACRGIVLEGIACAGVRQIPAALGGILEEIVRTRHEELGNFCVLTRG